MARTQIRNYDVFNLSQEKVLPDLAELATADILSSTSSLLNNLNRIRYQIKQITGEDNWFDTPSVNLKSLANRTFEVGVDDTWGLAARTQGMIIAPEGAVIDDGNGNITVPNILVSNPLTKTFIRIQGFSTSLGENGYIYFDLPPDSPVNSFISATVVDDNPYSPPSVSPFDLYPNQNRVVLAQRIGTGKVWFKFNWSVSSYS